MALFGNSFSLNGDGHSGLVLEPYLWGCRLKCRKQNRLKHNIVAVSITKVLQVQMLTWNVNMRGMCIH